jgi:hypothetical protein
LCFNRPLPIGAQKPSLGALCASAVNLGLKKTPMDLKDQGDQLNRAEILPYLDCSQAFMNGMAPLFSLKPFLGYLP